MHVIYLFTVTEKVWESESTDASEAEEPVPKAAKPKASPVKVSFYHNVLKYWDT